MELPASLREINPVLDQIARGGPAPAGADLRLAVSLGLVTPGGELTGAGRAYACPALAVGPAALVMSPARRAALVPLISTGPLPLQRALRRLLRLIAGVGRRLVAPGELALEWPESLLRPYLAYLEDLGLLLPIGPLVEVTPEGRGVVATPDSLPVWEPWQPRHRRPQAPSFQSAAFRYHLVRRVCMELLILRGRREWHHLQPLLEGPLAPLEPAFDEWMYRFRASQPTIRRTWSPDQVARYEAGLPSPDWFPVWTRALLGAEPGEAVQALTQTPFLLQDPAVAAGGDLPTREAWLVAAALSWAARRDRGLLYPEAAARLSLDGITLPPWPEMQATLETAGLLVPSQPGPDVHLLLPVLVQPPPEALWPYLGIDWLAAALLEGHAFSRHLRPRSGSQA